MMNEIDLLALTDRVNTTLDYADLMGDGAAVLGAFMMVLYADEEAFEAWQRRDMAALAEGLERAQKRAESLGVECE